MVERGRGEGGRGGGERSGGVKTKNFPSGGVTYMTDTASFCHNLVLLLSIMPFKLARQLTMMHT